MKSIIIVISFLFLTSISLGQAPFTASILLDRNNVIYTTVDNSISIQTNVEPSDIVCSINKNGIIEHNSYSSYSIRVTETGYYELTVKQKSTGKSISYTLRAKKLPIPIANLKDVSGDSISNQQLTQTKELNLSYVPAFDFNISSEIISFTLLKISKANSRTELNNFTATFSDVAKEILKSSMAGDILIFKNISAQGPDPGLLKIPDLILFVR